MTRCFRVVELRSQYLFLLHILNYLLPCVKIPGVWKSDSDRASASRSCLLLVLQPWLSCYKQYDYKTSLGFRLVTLRLHYPKLSNRPAVDPLVFQRVTASWTIQAVAVSE